MRSKVSTSAIACLALVGALVVFGGRHQSSAVLKPVQAATQLEAIAYASAGMTFEIVPAQAHATKITWAPRTGDGSN